MAENSSSTSLTCSSLSDDILIEIFAYLPLNSIYKFKCLSKVWLSNLSNRNFITKWFQLNRKSLPLIHYHRTEDFSNEIPLRFSFAYPDSHSEFMSRNEHLFSFKFLINKIPFQVARLYLLGSSNGLVLCEAFALDGQRRYHVCNPLTQKWILLPSPPHSQRRGFAVTRIFCEYSTSLTSCYKVVHIPAFNEPSKKFNVDIFCSDVGVWETFQVSCDESVIWGLFSFDKVVILNGVLYWIEDRDRMLVYSLNQKNQSDGHRCRLINLPDEDSESIIVESEGCLCCSSIIFAEGELTLNVWVLDEVNWKILHKDISLDDILAEVHSRRSCQFETVHVLGLCPVDHNVVLLGSAHCEWGFNIQTRRVERLCLDNRHGYRDSEKFQPFVLKPMPTVLPTPCWIDT